ncbi:hypothetical protein COO72_04800 [Bifidobacterium callitrichos]|nr:hypothetical protein COO72_04800 [Bifidobacterium callitrichos]
MRAHETGNSAVDTATDDTARLEYKEQWLQWHSRREEILTSPHGFLSIVDLTWLTDHGDVTVPSFPGSWLQDGDTITYIPDLNRVVNINGLPVLSERGYIVKAEEDADVAILAFNDVKAELIKRIGGTRTFAVRVRDPKSKLIADYPGTPYFEPDPKWIVPARFEPAQDKDTIVSVPASVDGLSHNEHVVGVLNLTVDGREYPLTVFQGFHDNSGIILFRDATSGKETYGGSRIITIGNLDPDALRTLDFNHALNLPCAYTPFCTCPFAPLQNHLPFAVTAGEKKPLGHE